ncbi:MAG TPA: YmaF family protein [Bacillales bacterium]|nr:YmaF family protein [Bacillales bacterium]
MHRSPSNEMYGAGTGYSQPHSNTMYWKGNTDVWHPSKTSINEETHVHEFRGVTSRNDGHHHEFVGTTYPADNKMPHTHEYFTVTHFDDKHRHTLSGRTGPAIPLKGGGHTHKIEGMTSVDFNHRHEY